jgi:hypothetical protein
MVVMGASFGGKAIALLAKMEVAHEHINFNN